MPSKIILESDATAVIDLVLPSDIINHAYFELNEIAHNFLKKD